MFLFVVSKIVPASAFSPLYVRCFVLLPPSPKTDFSGFALMRPSHRFHGDSHKTVRFPVLKRGRKKKLAVGVFSDCQRRGFKERCHFFQKVNLSLLPNSATSWILLSFFLPLLSSFPDQNARRRRRRGTLTRGFAE